MYVRLLGLPLILCLAAAMSSGQVAVPSSRSKPTVVIPPDTIDKKVSLLEGNVVLIHDGDTFTLAARDGKVYRIRLQGCDAPDDKQNHAEKSKQNLAVLIQGMDVIVAVLDKDIDDDAYFGSVYLEGRDVGLTQIESGMAWNSTANGQVIPEEGTKRYAQAQSQARAAGLGIWSEKDPMPPWVFRGEKNVPLPSKISPAPVAVIDSRIIGNINSGIYHWPGCSGYAKVAAHNRIVFNTIKDAETAGYRAAKNCSTPKP